MELLRAEQKEPLKAASWVHPRAVLWAAKLVRMSVVEWALQKAVPRVLMLVGYLEPSQAEQKELLWVVN